MTKSWLFLKFFQTSLLVFSENTLLLSVSWVVLLSKQSMFQRIFLKKSQFIVIYDEKRQFSKHHFSQSRVSIISLQTELSHSGFDVTKAVVYDERPKMKRDTQQKSSPFPHFIFGRSSYVTTLSNFKTKREISSNCCGLF
jgi:hypothetical protein